MKTDQRKINFRDKIRDVKDFPEKGVIFRDIAPLLEDKVSFSAMADELAGKVKHLKIDKIAGIDARGFILAAILAQKLGTGLVMLRKKGKLPLATESVEYDLEYGKATLEIHRDSVSPGENVLLVDDVLATGGTMAAAVELIQKVRGNIVGVLFLAVLDYLPGKKKLESLPLYCLLNYEK